jgi:hypothetical protein
VANDVSFTISLLSEDRQIKVNILLSYIFAAIHGFVICNFWKRAEKRNFFGPVPFSPPTPSLP